MIAHRLSDKNLHQLVTELLTRGRKLNISLVCITASYFAIPKLLYIIPHTIWLGKFQTKRSFNK